MGRSRRERKPVTYTFGENTKVCYWLWAKIKGTDQNDSIIFFTDDFDKSINDAIQRSKYVLCSLLYFVGANKKLSNFSLYIQHSTCISSLSG